MSEQENEPTQPETQPEGATGDETTTDEGHVSNVTDLPEGAEVDPLTDQQPVPVVEDESHDG